MFRNPAPVFFGLTAACLIASAPLHAADVDGTLAQKNGWAAYQTGIDRTAVQVDAKCGGRLRAGYDKTAIAVRPAARPHPGACQARSVRSPRCDERCGKQSVQARRGRCRFSTDGTRVTPNGDTLTVHIDPERTSITGAQAGSYSWASALREAL